MSEDVDFNALDPGIRQTVRWLRDNGFETTDSGDGVSKIGTPAEGCAWLVPNVAMAIKPGKLIEESKRLRHLLLSVRFDLDATYTDESGQEVPRVNIEATYWPVGDTALILLTGVDDQMLADLVGARRTPEARS